MNKIWILVIVLCLAAAAAIIYFLVKSFKKVKNIESFESPQLENNMLTNGSFFRGEHIKENTGSAGKNDVIVFPNNGQSSYVLRQSKHKKLADNEPAYYKVEVTLKPNTVYYLGALYFSSINNPLEHAIQFNGEAKQFLKTIDDPSKNPQKPGDFKYKTTMFKTPNDVGPIHAELQIGFRFNNMEGYNYITDIGLFEASSTNNIPVVADLRSYFNAFNHESIEEGKSTIKDLSANGFDFVSSNPKNLQIGNIDLANNILTGENAFKLQNQKMIKLNNYLTFFIYVKGNPEYGIYGDYGPHGSKNKCIESFTGEEDMARIVEREIIENEEMRSDIQELESDMSNLRASLDRIGAQQEELILRQQMPMEEELPSEMKRVMGNKYLYKPATKKGSGSTLIRFPGNQNNAIEIILPFSYGPIQVTAGGLTYKTEISYMPSMDSLFVFAYNGERFVLYLNGEPILETVCPKIYFNNQPVKINPDGDCEASLYAFAYYNKELTTEQISEVSKYLIKMKALGKELSKVSDKLIENVASFMIPERKAPGCGVPGQEEATTGETGSGTRAGFGGDNCPKTVFEDGHYYVIVPEGSKLSQEVGYSGVRDYGTNIDTAKMIFETNFPRCPVPDILDRRKYKADLNDCPFVMLTDDNPCKKFDCKKADWKKGEVKDKNCRKSIDSYCSKFADVDNACFCWRAENRDKPECLQWRGRFEAEDKCDFRKFPIDKHPEADQWIRKDKIPCWGCNLANTDSKNDYSSRKGSGAR